MKARVKETGEFIEVIPSIHSKGSYDGNDGYTYTEESLIMLEDEPDYWEKLRHQYVGMAMRGILSNPEQTALYDTDCVEQAVRMANLLINKLKEESQCEK